MTWSFSDLSARARPEPAVEVFAPEPRRPLVHECRRRGRP